MHLNKALLSNEVGFVGSIGRRREGGDSVK